MVSTRWTISIHEAYGARDTGEHAVALLDLKLPKVGGLDVPAQI
jgi:hypothetical protein